MEITDILINPKLKSLYDKHSFRPNDEEIINKILLYVDFCRKFNVETKIENTFIEILKMYLLEVFFKKKFLTILLKYKNTFIGNDLLILPEISSKESLIELHETLQNKSNHIRHKILLSKTLLPQDVLRLLNN